MFASVEPSAATVRRTVAFKSSSPLLFAKIKDAVNVSFTASFIGTPEGTRTPNPRNRNPMLYPLSHRCMLNSLDIIAVFFQFVKGGAAKIFRCISPVFDTKCCFSEKTMV